MKPPGVDVGISVRANVARAPGVTVCVVPWQLCPAPLAVEHVTADAVPLGKIAGGTGGYPPKAMAVPGAVGV